jgi:heavy metal translocating P-type ATPase
MAEVAVSKPRTWQQSMQGRIAILSLCCIALSLSLRIVALDQWIVDLPLFIAFVLGGTPLVWGLLRRLLRAEFGSDLLAGISIVTAVLLGEYLAGVFVILMLSGGEALEAYALRRASSVLDALAQRMPHKARRRGKSGSQEVSLSDVVIGDELELLPHDICPVDGVVLEGHGSMDESYLTGEPYRMPKAPGSAVLSGAINGAALLTIRATALPIDSRYQKIARVIESQAGKQVPMRRLADLLGTWYTPLAVALAALAWWYSGDALRFLAVLVVATPCPLLIAIPVCIISAISRCAKRGIIVKNPAALERVSSCRTMILDKTGTLTYGEPALVEVETSAGIVADELLARVAALEQYSKHPLAEAVLKAAQQRGIVLPVVASVAELPGKGLTGICLGKQISVTGRGRLAELGIIAPPQKPGLECIVLSDGALAAVLHFRDTPRTESKAFVKHLGPQHQINKVMILSGDRDSEVQHLANIVGISDIQGGLTPEQKLTRVIAETQAAPTLYIGDGINDAPALQAATVGIAIGTKSDITSEAASVVIMEQSLERVDEFLHISVRMRQIALQSAVGGMSLSVLGMGAAAFGLLTPLAGAIAQELIDVLAVVNALRVALDVSKPGDDLRG